MEQILIYHPDGSYEPIHSNSQVSVITQAEHKKVLLGEDVITMTIESATTRNFAIGDYIKIFGLSKYKINQLPKLTKISERKYQYELVFEGLQYDLLRVSYRNTDISSFNNSSDFSLIGNLEMFLNVLINNLNRVFGTSKWILEDFPATTETRNLAFSNENCLAVLQRLCDEYKYQFTFSETSTQNILKVKSVGAELDFNFKYGQGKGLYELTRENVDSKNIINTLWAYGSEKNLPADYKNFSPRLRLGNADDLPIFDTVSRSAYGIFEGSIIFDDIYPHRTGTVTGVNPANRLEFIDTTMDFDLNEMEGGNSKYQIPGNVAKIHFQTGNLAGYEFEIDKYIASIATFRVKQNKDQKGLEMPSADEAAFQIGVGDTYVMIDIIMPNTYISAAEAELQAKAIEYLNDNCVPTVKYSLVLDEFYLKDKAESMNIFEVGDTVNIEDTDLGVNARIKIIEFTRDIIRPYKYTLVIKDMPQPNIRRNVVSQINVFRRVIKKAGLDDPTRNKTDWRSDTQILAEIPNFLENNPLINIGRKAEQVNVGLPEGLVSVLGKLGIKNPLGALVQFDTGLLQSNTNYTFKFPDANPEGITVLNDWNYIVAKPTFFAQQEFASDTWVVSHQLGKKCICQTYNTNGDQIFGNIKQLSDNELQVTFKSLEMGYALIIAI